MTRLAMLTAACAVGLTSAVALANGAQTTTFSSANDFQSFCSSCHGTTGKGDGVLAGSLKKRPSDLTLLTIKSAGVFPADAVLKIIDGGHETNDMPAWKDVFAKSQESAGADAAQTRMRSLVSYLETMQQKP